MPCLSEKDWGLYTSEEEVPQKLADHLKVCPACLEKAESYSRIRSKLSNSELEDPGADYWNQMERNILDRLPAKQDTLFVWDRLQELFRLPAKPAWGAVAVFAAILITAVFLFMKPAENNAPVLSNRSLESLFELEWPAAETRLSELAEENTIDSLLTLQEESWWEPILSEVNLEDEYTLEESLYYLSRDEIETLNLLLERRTL